MKQSHICMFALREKKCVTIVPAISYMCVCVAAPLVTLYD